MDVNTSGANWNRWDLHMHTPGTQKEDRYEGSDLDDKWKKYIETINNYSEEVAAVGVTDYLSIDNYKRFLVEKSAIRKDIELVVPNVELRMVPVTGQSTPINLHCIFNPLIVDSLEAEFFSKIRLNTDDSYSASRADLMKLGRTQTEQAVPDDVAYNKGIGQFIVDFGSFKKVFTDNPELRKNTIIVVANSSNDGVSGIIEHFKHVDGSSQLDTVRSNIYRLADAIFSSFPKDREYFCGLKVDSSGKLIDKEAVKKKVGSLKPCFHGCDAHTNSKVFEPDRKRYCWIKAELTFDGLKQTLYEPDLRVKIQSSSPVNESKKIVLDTIKITQSSKFKIVDQTIPLNRDLITFIGGRGSGKSLFLETLASLNEAHTPYDINGKPKVIENMRQTSADALIEVNLVDKDGNREVLAKTFSETKNLNLPILYIGQEELSHIATDDDLLTPTIRSFLGIDGDERDTSFIDNTIPYDISRIDQSSSSIDSLKSKYSADDNLNYDLHERLTDLEKEKGLQIKRLSSPETEQLVIELTEIISGGQKIKNINDAFPLLEHDLNDLKLNKQIKSMNEMLAESGLRFLKDIPEIDPKIQRDLISKNKTLLSKEREKLEIKYKVLTGKLKKLGIKEDVRLLTESIRKLQQEINAIIKDRKIYDELLDDTNTYKDELAAMGLGLRNHMNWSAEAIDKAFTSFKDTSELLGVEEQALFQRVIEGVEVKGAIEFDEENFFNILRRECFDSRIIKDIPTIRRIFTSRSKLTFEEYIDFWMTGKTWNAIDTQKFTKSGRQKFIEIVFTRWREYVNVMTKASLNNVAIENLSIGQRGTLLLKLYLASATDKQIFIIDQPEDNLDNKFISEQMVPMLREIKKTRQIILSTHNANIVVGCDADQVIVARLDERLVADRSYVSGGIENPLINNYIQTILEGGANALAERYRRYM